MLLRVLHCIVKYLVPMSCVRNRGVYSQLGTGLERYPQLETGLEGYPQLETGLEGYPQLGTGLEGSTVHCHGDNLIKLEES